MRRRRLDEVTPEFVDEIPSVPEHGKLYLSCRYRAAIPPLRLWLWRQDQYAASPHGLAAVVRR